MARVRVLGPRPRLDETLAVLQDGGLVHLDQPTPQERLEPVTPTLHDLRAVRHLQRMRGDLEAITASLPAATAPPIPPSVGDLARWARAGERARATLTALDAEGRDLEEERTGIVRMQQFIAAFRGLLPATGGTRMHSYHLVLRAEDTEAVPRLRHALAEVIGEEFALEATDLPTGERAAVLLVPVTEAARVERLLAQAGVHELPLPPRYAGRPLGELGPELGVRRDAVDRRLAEIADARSQFVQAQGPSLATARAAVEDRLLTLAAREQAAATPRGFVLEGWTPAAAVDRLEKQVHDRLGPEIVIEMLAREEWRVEDAPVVLNNPRLFRPFEALTGMLPLPRYGTIDPTPFIAVFFPMFFGLIMGDVGYGLVLGIAAGLIHKRSRAGTMLRSISEILGACAIFSVAFGIAFGEFFGDLGHRWFHQRPLVLNREESLLPFLGLAVAIGFVHILLGLVLGVINAAHGHPRQAIGRSASVVMLMMVAVALLAAVKVLPGAFFTPAIVILLVAFPVLVVTEGIVAPIEFLSTLSNILSYARIMALGTASVMMAVVANKLAGEMGSVVVGLLFGLLFHVVNFALAVFAPTIHGLRLHYVEFFGKFYSPGGQQFRPFSHWRPGSPRPA